MQIINTQNGSFWQKAPNLGHYIFFDLVCLPAILLREASSFVRRWGIFKISPFWDKLYYRAPPETTMGRAKGSWDIWQGASEEHPTKWGCDERATMPDVPNAVRPKGCAPFGRWQRCVSAPIRLRQRLRRDRDRLAARPCPAIAPYWSDGGLPNDQNSQQRDPLEFPDAPFR